MTDNPYQPPLAHVANQHRDGIHGQIRHREFRAKMFSLTFFSSTHTLAKLRNEAEAFINDDVGADNVVSIAEHSGLEYIITVWYQTRGLSDSPAT